MRRAEVLADSLVSACANGDFTEAVLGLSDGSRLCFCHRVGERWAKAVRADEHPEEGGIADELLAAIAMFRLNAKHLDIQFQDGSRWEEAVPRDGVQLSPRRHGRRGDPTEEPRPKN